MLFVPNIRVNLLSISSFEDGGYGITFQQGQVCVSSEEATQDLVVVLAIRYERFYKLLSQPMVGYSGYLDTKSEFDSCEAFFGTTGLSNL